MIIFGNQCGDAQAQLSRELQIAEIARAFEVPVAMVRAQPESVGRFFERLSQDIASTLFPELVAPPQSQGKDAS